MTTQHIQPEHSDVEVDVAEHSSASENNASPSSLETTLPVQETQAEHSSTAEAVEATETAETIETPSADAQHIALEEEQQPAFQMEIENVPEASNVEPVDVEVSEVRPFTDFVEEFRQAEERFKVFLQAYQAATIGAPSEPAEAAAAEPLEPSSSQAVEEQFIAPTATDAESAPTQPMELPIAYDVEVEATLNASQLTAPEETTAQTKGTTPPERPVSPLLRPASRLRLPRHGAGRQREEVPVEKIEPGTSTEAPAESTVEEPKTEAPIAGPTPTQEQPRPARRYRFDRKGTSTSDGSATNSSLAIPASPSTTKPQMPVTPPAQVPSREENKDVSHRGITPVPGRAENEHATNGQTVEREVQSTQNTKQPATGTNGTQLPEQTTPKQATVQESPIEETGTTTATPEQDRRRRHGRDRQHGKEQPTLTPTPTAVPVTPAVPPLPAAAFVLPGLSPAAEVVPVEAEPVTPPSEEVNPEDLPPLEYSELQKANSRRRRRRHGTPLPSKATETPTIPPTTPTAPTTPTPTPSVAMPRTPAAPHTITSGYTLNQMKQSHDGTSPFMGPDPSPARGSIAAQHVRSIRTDAQRAPVYPVRTTEATSASVQQLASVVAQALQTQTDRMIAELRRANQTPTNISVSLPPFPSTERVGVFVDVANLLYSARTLRITINFGKLLDFLRGNRRLVRAQAYCPTSPQPGDEQMFLQAVKGLGYRITTKNYKTFSSGAKKADLDLDLCMDVVRLVDGKAVDCIVLVSGDSDFMPMLDYCSDHGVRVEVAAFDEAMSATLRQSCDLFINLGMLEEIRA